MTYEQDIQSATQFLQQGVHKRALKAAVSAIKKSPNSAVAHNIAGIACSAIGQQNDAIKHFQSAIKLKPEFHEARCNLAQTLLLSGRAGAALTMLLALTAQTPKDWKVWFLQAQAQMHLGKEIEALHSVDRAIALSPSLATLFHLRSQINLALGHIKTAIEDLKKVLEINPDDVVALTNLSLPLARQTLSQEALDVVQRAVEIAPDDLSARYRLATQLVEMGRPDEAIVEYKAILLRHADHASTLEQLSYLLDKDALAGFEDRVQGALSKAAKNTADRACLFFAMSSIKASGGHTEDADKMLALANKEMARLSPYDPVADAAVTQAILDRFSVGLVMTQAQDSACYPIFVLGLPRSGTTLVEAVLGAHPQVAALGERGTMGFLLRNIIENDLPFGPEDVKKLVQQDQQLLPDLPARTRAYIDKMPENYRIVGFLKQAYPNARIVSVRRDPLDIALSMWKSHFSGRVLSYAYDWDWMSAKFNLYARSMDHWAKVFPGQIYDLSYENLVNDVEGEGRKLAEYCGLDWHSGMARPDESTQQVLTLSANQLRRPVHTKSVGRGRQRLDLLAPFVAGLDPDVWAAYLPDQRGFLVRAE